MGDLIEKITLYDLLGYTLPGSVLISTIICTNMGRFEKMLIIYSDYVGYIFLMFICISFLCGIVISEIARWPILIIESEWALWEWINEDICVEMKVVEKALVNSGVVSDKDNLKDCCLKKYYKYMYDDIQTDREYTRVHKYASAEGMYKNMTITILLSIIIWYINVGIDSKGIVLGLGICTVFSLRWWRFYKKTKVHVINWFVKKHVDRIV